MKNEILTNRNTTLLIAARGRQGSPWARWAAGLMRTIQNNKQGVKI